MERNTWTRRGDEVTSLLLALPLISLSLFLSSPRLVNRASFIFRVYSFDPSSSTRCPASNKPCGSRCLFVVSPAFFGSSSVAGMMRTDAVSSSYRAFSFHFVSIWRREREKGRNAGEGVTRRFPLLPFHPSPVFDLGLGESRLSYDWGTDRSR